MTTSIQEVHLDKHIRLLDSPGIIASSDQGPLMGCVKTEQLEDPIRVVDGVLSKISSQKLATIYHTDEFDTAEKFLELLALSRGKLKRGGIPDMVAVAKMVLQVNQIILRRCCTLDYMQPGLCALISRVAVLTGLEQWVHSILHITS